MNARFCSLFNFRPLDLKTAPRHRQIMSDRFFYPFAIVLITAIIVGALNMGGPMETPTVDPAKIAAEGYMAKGDDLRQVVNAPGTSAEYVLNSDGGVEYAVYSAHTAIDQAPASAGIFVQLNPEYEKAFGGKKVRVTVHAKADGDMPTDAFLFRYYTIEASNSAKTWFPAPVDFSDVSFEYTPAVNEGEPKVDFVGIWPDRSGMSRKLLVKSISVKIAE